MMGSPISKFSRLMSIARICEEEAEEGKNKKKQKKKCGGLLRLRGAHLAVVGEGESGGEEGVAGEDADLDGPAGGEELE